MTAVRMSAAELAALGIDVDAATPTPTPARRGRQRRALPTARSASTCHDCGERFTTEAGAARHNRDTGHARYQLELGI